MVTRTEGTNASRVEWGQPGLFGRYTVPIVPRDVDLKARISYAIRVAREDRRLSRRELAEEVGVGPSAVGDWENGVSVPSLLHLGALADALNVDADLFAHPPPIPESPVARWRRSEPGKDRPAASSG